MPITPMPIQDVASLANELSQMEGNAARCLEFALLAAARPGEATALRWDQIDLARGSWRTPSVQRSSDIVRPLSGAAVRLLSKQSRGSELVFPNARGGSLTPMTLLAVLKKVVGPEAMTSSLRHAFAAWACDNTDHPADVVRTAMGLLPQDAHLKFEQFGKPKRLAESRKLMDRWAEQLMAVHA